MLKQIINEALKEIKNYFGEDLKKICISPRLVGSLEKYTSITPSMVFEGPTIKQNKMSFDRTYEDIGENSTGVMIRGVKKWFVHIDLIFRVFLFITSPLNELSIVEKANTLRGGLKPITIDDNDYEVCFDDDFRDDITVNFSDIIQYETECIIEDIKIRKEEYDEEVIELKEIHFDFTGEA